MGGGGGGGVRVYAKIQEVVPFRGQEIHSAEIYCLNICGVFSGSVSHVLGSQDFKRKTRFVNQVVLKLFF